MLTNASQAVSAPRATVVYDYLESSQDTSQAPEHPAHCLHGAGYSQRPAVPQGCLLFILPDSATLDQESNGGTRSHGKTLRVLSASCFSTSWPSILCLVVHHVTCFALEVNVKDVAHSKLFLYLVRSLSGYIVPAANYLKEPLSGIVAVKVSSPEVTSTRR